MSKTNQRNAHEMKRFYFTLANSLAAFLINMFVWFAITFWVYLETRSVMAMAVMAGIYTSTVALSGLFLGSPVPVVINGIKISWATGPIRNAVIGDAACSTLCANPNTRP